MATRTGKQAPADDHTPPEGLPTRWAVILLAGMVAGLVAAQLTYAQTRSWPGSLLAALAAAGATTAGAHQVLAAR